MSQHIGPHSWLRITMGAASVTPEAAVSSSMTEAVSWNGMPQSS